MKNSNSNNSRKPLKIDLRKADARAMVIALMEKIDVIALPCKMDKATMWIYLYGKVLADAMRKDRRIRDAFSARDGRIEWDAPMWLHSTASKIGGNELIPYAIGYRRDNVALMEYGDDNTPRHVAQERAACKLMQYMGQADQAVRDALGGRVMRVEHTGQQIVNTDGSYNPDGKIYMGDGRILALEVKGQGGYIR